jgi:integrator complex subunit 2
MYLVGTKLESRVCVLLQGYPQELLPITATGIPSMHICLDFIPELLSQPSLEKQIFAMDLVSHLAVQYALPKSLSVARLAINTLSTLLGGEFLHEVVN